MELILNNWNVPSSIKVNFHVMQTKFPKETWIHFASGVILYLLNDLPLNDLHQFKIKFESWFSQITVYMQKFLKLQCFN